jgi:hypothetical protein
VIHLKRSLARVLLVVILLLTANWLWTQHITAWNPDMRSPVLGYDAAQYALAAQHLVDTGTLGTTYALPIELARHPAPPWPLAVVQPGLILVEAWIFKVTPKIVRIPGVGPMLFNDRARREELVLVLPFICFLAIGATFGLATAHLILRLKSEASVWTTTLAGLAVGLAFLLDPEAQHFASGGFTELPFTLGLVAATAALALGRATRHPFTFGLLLGCTGLFRGSILWIAPWFVLGVAIAADPGRRVRTAAIVTLGFILPLSPWWIYKWRAFGTPAWDLSGLSLWDGVQGRSWFTLNHLPEWPTLPGGAAAIGLIAGKIAHNLSRVTLAVLTGPRALWVGAIVLWLFVTKRRDATWATALALTGAMLTSLLVATATIPWLRYAFPTRVIIEAAGLLALWDLIGRVSRESSNRTVLRLMRAGVAAIAIMWGGLQTERGLQEAATSTKERGTPDTPTIDEIVELMHAELRPDEPVMSNLGPILAWRSEHPVIHLAQTPDDVAACREFVEFRNVILVFREPDRAWAGWDAIMQRPGDVPSHPEWNVKFVRQFRSVEGFDIVWLELGPMRPGLARTTPPTTEHHGPPSAVSPSAASRSDAPA